MIEKDIIEIQDKFLIDDTHSNIRGFVAAYDENGNRIFLKENMIVKAGRKKILEHLRTPGNNINFFSNMKAFLDTSTDVTKPDMELPSNITEIDTLDIIETKKATPAKFGTAANTEITDTHIREDIAFSLVECFRIKYTASEDNLNGTTRFGSMGLYFPSSNTLFSRLTFPPYSARTNLTFYYYLYF